MSKIKVIYETEEEKQLIEKYGFEAVAFRDPTPEEQKTIENINNFFKEVFGLGLLLSKEQMLVRVFSSLVISTSSESK